MYYYASYSRLSQKYVFIMKIPKFEKYSLVIYALTKDIGDG